MLVGASPRRVAIVGGVRIPFVRGNGAYARVGNQEMLTASLRGVVDRYGLKGQRLDDVAAGAVMKHSSQWNLTRESVLGSGLAAETPGLDLQRACGTSLEAAILLGNKIALGQIDCAIAAGVDTVSDPPVVYPRAEQDELALESHQKAAAAYASGFYKDLVLPYLGVPQDNNIRNDTTLEKLAKLKPVFDTSGAGTLTAGNSTPMTDGASAVLLASDSYARERDLPVLAYLSYGKVAAVDYIDKKEGLLMAPAYAVPRMLSDAHLALQDFDFYAAATSWDCREPSAPSIGPNST